MGAMALLMSGLDDFPFTLTRRPFFDADEKAWLDRHHLALSVCYVLVHNATLR
jgi:hypothetical protein